MPYQVHPKTGYIDYDRLEETAALFRPQLIVCGASAYPRDWDYARLRAIADQRGAYLMCDMAHISGIVAARECNDPFEHCDVVTTTTHKTLRGPRAGMIFFRKGIRNEKTGEKYELEDKVNSAVFPSLQGGPHENTIAGIAVALKEASTPEFREYIVQVKNNAKKLAQALMEMGYSVVTEGTDNHIVLWNVKPQGMTGSKLEKLFEHVTISVNKNAVYGDVSALSPGGIRLGTPAMTSRGLKEADFQKVAEFLDRGMKIAIEVQQSSPSKLLQDFLPAMHAHQGIKLLREEVIAFAQAFPLPG